MLPNNRPHSNPPVHSAFAFFDKGPQLICINDVGRNDLNFLIVNHLGFMTSGTNHTHTGVISDTRDSRESAQTTPLSMGLKNGLDRVRRNLTAIIEGIKGLAEGLLTVQAAIALAAFTGLTVFVGLWMTT